VTALLLDTHVLIWWWSSDPHLGAQARRLIVDPQIQVWVSAVTIWEIVIKAGLGRLQVAKRLDKTLLDELVQDSFRPLPISAAHALAVKQLPAVHRDPFDRMLVAQAAAENLTLVTADPLLMRYGINAVSATA
jgi:PIN domain nuclease of toxin-antitoxin system